MITIYYIKNSRLCSEVFEYVNNLSSFENELDSLYDFWSYDLDDALNYF